MVRCGHTGYLPSDHQSTAVDVAGTQIDISVPAPIVSALALQLEAGTNLPSQHSTDITSQPADSSEGIAIGAGVAKRSAAK